MIIIGVGGPSSSGKSTLSRKLANHLYGSIYILDIDAFFKFDTEIPLGYFHRTKTVLLSEPLREGRDQFHEKIIHKDIETESEIVEWRDWDCDNAIEWNKYNQVLKDLYRLKTESKNAISHFLNENKDYFHLYNLDNNPDQNTYNEEIIVIIEGFLIYHQFAFTDLFDCCFLLDAPFDICRQRRRQLSTIFTKGGVWDDPPGYYELAVWPRYLKMKDWILESKTINNRIHILTIDKNTTISILLNDCLAFIPSNLYKD